MRGQFWYKGVGGICLVIISLFPAYILHQLSEIAAEHEKWNRLFNELGVAMPGMNRLVNDYNPFSTHKIIIPSIIAIIYYAFTIYAVRSVITNHARVFVVSYISVCTIFIISLSFILYSTRHSLDSHLKHAMDLELKPHLENVNRMIGTFSDDKLDDQKRIDSARALRAVGLKIQVGLIDTENAEISDAIKSLQSIATNPAESPGINFASAWALIVIDRESTKSKDAIAHGMLTAHYKGDEDAKNFSERYMEHPVVKAYVEQHPEAIEEFLETTADM